MKWGEELPAAHDLSSLRLLGSVGEPINPEAWIWYRTHIGGDRCPIVDTWWQTETGGILITPLPGITATKPGAAMTPFPGIAADVIDDDGNSVGNDEGGYLVITEPWPGMTRGIYGDDERFIETYWKRFPGKYFAGDGAKRDEDGDLWLLGRVDDVMNISGHRISTTEVEHALVEPPGRGRGGRGRAPTTPPPVRPSWPSSPSRGRATSTARRGSSWWPSCATTWPSEIGPIAKPRQILLTPELPKTRSGKIMRRLLRDVADDRPAGRRDHAARPDGRQRHQGAHGGGRRRQGIAAELAQLRFTSKWAAPRLSPERPASGLLGLQEVGGPAWCALHDGLPLRADGPPAGDPDWGAVVGRSAGPRAVGEGSRSRGARGR